MKYRPSVANAAFSKVMTAVPAEPEKPQMYSKLNQLMTLMGEYCADLAERHKRQCTLIDGYLPREQLLQHQRVTKLRKRTESILYTSNLCFFIRSLNFPKRSVLFTVSMSSAVRCLDVEKGLKFNEFGTQGFRRLT